MKLKKNNLKVNQLFIVSIFLFFIGCELEVNNPNSINYENLDNPVTANALANGSLVNIAAGMGFLIAPYSVATDEVTWIGSRHAWGELDDGNLSHVANEFIDQAWGPFASARWTADNAIQLIEGFEVGSYDINDLARTYMYAALVRVMIGDMFDDFVYSNRTEAGNAIGSEEMYKVYDEAIVLLDNAENLNPSTDLLINITALRARAKYSIAVWYKVQPPVNTANPYVDAGVDDAISALTLGDDLFRWQMLYSDNSTTNDLSFQVNARAELLLSPEDNDADSTFTSDVRVQNIIAEFTDVSAGQEYAPLTITSAKEMYLIRAESDYVNNQLESARTLLNLLRSIDGLAADDSTDIGEMLQYERRVNLYLQGRRLADMYRFNEKSEYWLEINDAVSTTGTFFPIPLIEIESNPNIP
jgi:hypothetical protein